MRETEIKLRIPPQALAAVTRAVTTRRAESIRLRAAYFDTPDRALARHHIGWRWRQEGRRWVQTAKAAGADSLSRLEHDAILGGRAPAEGSLPEISRHTAHPALMAKLQAALSEAQGPLTVRYATDIRRTRRTARHAGAMIELALDIGVIRAAGREHPVAELELELLRGEPSALLDLAECWIRRFGLWIDVRSKAQLGDWLAEGQPTWPAVKFKPPVIAADAPGSLAMGLALQAAMAPVLANLAVLGDEGVANARVPESPTARISAREAVSASHSSATHPSASYPHLHQVRVGLRRLRVLGDTLAGWLPQSASAESAESVAWQSWLDGTASLFRQWGAVHDDEMLQQLLAPVYAVADKTGLGGAGADGSAQWLCKPSPAQPSPLKAREQATQLWLIQTLKWMASLTSVAAATDPTGSAVSVGSAVSAGHVQSARDHARAAVRALWRRIRRRARGFEGLSDEDVHKLRKDIKRLRYALALSRSLWSGAKSGKRAKSFKPDQPAQPLQVARLVDHFGGHLAAAQEAVGAYTDLLVASERLHSLLGQAPDMTPQALAAHRFVQGWVLGRQAPARRACAAPLATLLKAKRPWR